MNGIRKAMTRRILIAIAAGMLSAATAFSADDGPVVGIVQWAPGLERDATPYDKTDYWAAIAYSPDTGKYGSSGEWPSRDNAERAARRNCNAQDARVVVLCCNGWCALALGETGKGGWGVGWGPSQELADRFALAGARENTRGARVVYSINARAPLVLGVIAYSTATGRWGYSFGYGRSDVTRAVEACEDPGAEVMVSKLGGAWMALALGDKMSVYGWGYAGNRIDAEQTALDECGKRTKNAKVAVSFCTSGIVH
jgi:hypothetical protein